MLISTSKIHEEILCQFKYSLGKENIKFFIENFYFILHFVTLLLVLPFLCKHIHEVILRLICPKPMIFLSCAVCWLNFFLLLCYIHFVNSSVQNDKLWNWTSLIQLEIETYSIENGCCFFFNFFFLFLVYAPSELWHSLLLSSTVV